MSGINGIHFIAIVYHLRNVFCLKLKQCRGTAVDGIIPNLDVFLFQLGPCRMLAFVGALASVVC